MFAFFGFQYTWENYVPHVAQVDKIIEIHLVKSVEITKNVV